MWRSITAVTFLMAAVDTAGAAPPKIFPAGGAVEQTPTLWVSADQMPAIEVTTASGPVQFELDEMPVTGGVRRIALRPQVGEGPFTVKLNGRPFQFESDASLDRDDDDRAPVDFQRFAIERRHGTDLLVIEALAEPDTMLYFVDHSLPADPGGFTRYTWVGPGKLTSRGEGTMPGVVRFELPLAHLGVSCASTRTIPLSPYTMHLDSQTTLHPIGTLEFARGQVKLSLEQVGRFGASPAWQPCVGASASAATEPGKLDPVAISSLVATHPISSGMAITDFSDLAEMDGIYGGLLGPRIDTTMSPTDYPDLLQGGLLGPSFQEPPIEVTARHDRLEPARPAADDRRWWSALVGFGVLLLLWRATARVAA
jgi:hypothetical protein